MLNKIKAINVRSHTEGFHSCGTSWKKRRRREERTWGRAVRRPWAPDSHGGNVPELEVVSVWCHECIECHWVTHSTAINFNFGLATFTSNLGTWKAEAVGLLQIWGLLELQNVTQKNLFMWISSHFFNAIPQPMNSARKPSLSPRFPPQIWTLDAWLLTKGKKQASDLEPEWESSLYEDHFWRTQQKCQVRASEKKMYLISISHLFWLVVSFLCSIKTSFQKYQCV